MEGPSMTYKQLHEQFMQNHTGTTVEQTLLILTPAPFTIFISVLLLKYFLLAFTHEKTPGNKFFSFFIEFFILVVTQVLLFMLPDYNTLMYFLLFSTGICFLILIVVMYIREIIVHNKSLIIFHKTLLTGRRPYITYFRSSVNLITTVCILAVDFTSFPRKLAKTELYGFSLMDTGVGFFVVCNALVGRHLNKYEVNDGRLRTLYKQLKHNSILLILGVIRVVSTKSIDYQVHNSEYGVHWNFFITLAFTRIISTLLLTFVRISRIKYLAFIVILIHQTSLSLGLEDWVRGDIPRDNLITANREGISSLLGYIGLYLVSVELAHKFNFKSTTIERDAKLVVWLILNTFISYFLLLQLNNYFQCSRRLANISYIVWILMLTIYLLALCLLFEIILRLCSGLKFLKDDGVYVPSILLSINYNALPFFLLSNLLTGIVNLLFKTLYVSEIPSILIVIVYMFLNCGIASILYYKQIKLL